MDIQRLIQTINTQPATGKLATPESAPGLRNQDVLSVLSQSDKVDVKTRFASDDFKALRDGTTTLARGAKGEQVKVVQNALLAMGFWTGGSKERVGNGVYGTADGDFGGKMQTAIKNFQDNRGLPQTGVIDQKTFQELERLAPAKGETIWSPTYAVKDATFVPSNILPNGETARIVADLSENRLFVFKKGTSQLEGVYSTAVGKINPATNQSVTSTGYKKIDNKLSNPGWLGEQLYQQKDIFGPKLLSMGDYNLKTGHVSNNPHEIHGTNNQNSVGDDASSGCLRLLNHAVEDLFPTIDKGEIVHVKH